MYRNGMKSIVWKNRGTLLIAEQGVHHTIYEMLNGRLVFQVTHYHEDQVKAQVFATSLDLKIYLPLCVESCVYLEGLTLEEAATQALTAVEAQLRSPWAEVREREVFRVQSNHSPVGFPLGVFQTLEAAEARARAASDASGNAATVLKETALSIYDVHGDLYLVTDKVEINYIDMAAVKAVALAKLSPLERKALGL